MNKTNHTEDELLVMQYQSGDGLALQELVRRWHKTFCEKAYWLTKDADASKDIAQDSWNTIILKIDSLRDPARVQCWALRIVFTKAMDWMRSNQKNRKKLEDYHQNYDVETEEHKNDEALKKALLKAISELPIEQQQAIRLFYVEEYSLKEIGDLLKLSVGTVKSRLFHAREKLKVQFKNRNYEN